MNLKNACIGVEEYFPPRIIGEVTDRYLKIAKIKGQKYSGIIMKMTMNFSALQRGHF